MADGDSGERLIADLREHGRVVAYMLVDGSTAKASYVHDNARPMVLDAMDTLAAAKESGRFLLQVESIDDDSGDQMDLFINVDAVVAVKIQRTAGLLASIA
jgi:hypothetical protein